MHNNVDDWMKPGKECERDKIGALEAGAADGGI